MRLKVWLGIETLTCYLQAQAQFENWHAERWLSPRRVLQKAGAEMQPVLLPFWFFEAAIKVDYCAQVLFLVPFQDPQHLPPFTPVSPQYMCICHHLVLPSACCEENVKKTESSHHRVPYMPAAMLTNKPVCAQGHTIIVVMHVK